MFKRLSTLLCILVLSDAALISPLEYNLYKINNKMLSKKLTGAKFFDPARGTGINWTWTDWQKGPTCPDSASEVVDVIDLNTTTEPFQKAFSAIDFLINDALAQLKELGWTHGISFGVTYNGKVIYTANAGTIDKDKNIRPTKDTIFAIASNTKIFTSRTQTFSFKYLLYIYVCVYMCFFFF